MGKRKVLITDGMSHDAILFVTDAPSNEIENYLMKYAEELENGENTYLEYLQKSYFVQVLFDSEESADFDKPEEIGWDESYDLFHYRKGYEEE